MARLTLTLLFMLIALPACERPGKQDMDAQLSAIIDTHKLTPELDSTHAIPATDTPLFELGKLLFFSTLLSGNGDVACVSCHHPSLGGGDALSLPLGVDAVDPSQLGHSRKLNLEKVLKHSASHTGPANVPRNSPTTFNSTHYKRALFWDGRVRVNEATEYDGGIITPDSLLTTSDQAARNDLLFAQSRFPVTSADEMLGFDQDFSHRSDIREHIAQKFQAKEQHENWAPLFKDAFPSSDDDLSSLLSFTHISEALTAYQRSQNFINNPWFDYLRGNKAALTEKQKKGAVLFYQGTEKGAQSCVSCHSGSFFTDENYYNLAAPQIGPGKDKLDNDFGRKRVTRGQDDKYRFRTPSLLNVAVTAPYFHSGSYDDIHNTLKHHNTPEQMIENYSVSNIMQFQMEKDIDADYPHIKQNSLTALKQAKATGDLPDMGYSDAELLDITAFLHALTDPCTKDPACLSPWILTSEEITTHPSGMQLLDVVIR